MKINFITSNKGKVISLQKDLKCKNKNIDVVQQVLEIVEPQADNVREVSKNKALQAYKILNEPVLVEDGGFCIEALNGFPGVYTKYILDTIGAKGILKLMENEKDRRCGFVSCATYIDCNGKIFQFESSETGSGELAYEMCDVFCEEAWSDIWYIYKIKATGKTLAEMSLEREKTNRPKSGDRKGSIGKFVDWFSEI